MWRSRRYEQANKNLTRKSIPVENRTLCGLIANEYEAPALIKKTEYIITIISSP